jgi:hypothetical protein
MMPRRSFLTLAAAAGGNDIFHIAIFRFAKENINDAMAAFRALASAGYHGTPAKLQHFRSRATNNPQPCVSRSLLAARFWVAAAITWCCLCPKTGVAIRNESRSSPASYIGLRQLLRNSIHQQQMLHDFQFNFGIQVQASLARRPHLPNYTKV